MVLKGSKPLQKVPNIALSAGIEAEIMNFWALKKRFNEKQAKKAQKIRKLTNFAESGVLRGLS